MNDSVQFLPVLPEIIVALAGCVVLVVDLFLPKDGKEPAFVLTLLSLVLALAVLVMQFGAEPSVLYHGAVVVDDLAVLLKIGVVIAVALLLVYGRQYNRDRDLFRGEFFVLALFGLAGMMVLASANHLITLYMGLELMSLCMYAMIAMQRDSGRASESAMKYFVLGALASGILLYGMSLVYGIAGTMEFGPLSEAIAGADKNATPLVLAVIFVVVGLAFKLGAVPFHMWVPDVYHGAATSTTVFIGSAPKLAAFAMIARLLISGLGEMHVHWGDMLVVLAVLSVAIGNVVAIAQSNLKRMLAYSTISHMGFFLFGILAGNALGYGAALFYVFVYTLMSLGAFGVLLVLSTRGFDVENLDDLAGLNRTHPWIAMLMLLLMFSMAGVPPTIGFYAKLSVIQALLSVDLVWVAVVAVLLAVIGAFYYLRVIKIMYFDPSPETRVLSPQPGAVALLSVNALAVLWLMPLTGIIVELCQDAVMVLQ
ncbi:MAG: NADH-quinone oxidoreductase subunit NuoN [Proteobacteria bacterium]|nr:MAG: NADH-quinone oxidoreductase subunit NuoN [Pseudomonadota bacterium]